jgi:hypothetical protein
VRFTPSGRGQIDVKAALLVGQCGDRHFADLDHGMASFQSFKPQYTMHCMKLQSKQKVFAYWKNGRGVI